MEIPSPAKKILIIADGLPAGGLERQVVELLKGLRDYQDFTTCICVLSSGGARQREAFEAADIVVSNYSAKNAGYDLLAKYPFIVASVLTHCRTIKPDLVHTYGSFSDVVGACISRIFSIPFVHGSIRAARPSLNYRDWISRLTLPLAKKVIANSRAGLKSFGLVADGKAIVIHNGVELDRFANVQPIRSDRTPIICMVSNFTAKKDQDTIVHCLPSIRQKYPEALLLLIGKGQRINTVKDLAISIGCEENVQIVSDCESPEEYIAGADICLLFSNIAKHGEGISNAIIEYMAMEKAVVASNCGGNCELVCEGETGFLIENNDREKIIQSILLLLDNSMLAKEMGRKGRKVIEEKFNLKKMTSMYVQLYLQVLLNE